MTYDPSLPHCGPHDDVIVEACCDSVHTARAAQAFGAGRVELCGPGAGGTTPSLGLIARVRDELQIPLHVMIRPHSNGFVYADDDFDVMCNDIVTARALGADGVVVGPLRSDATVDQHQLAELIALARPLRVVFHRAFDRTPDASSAFATLRAMGVDGVLTSGHAATALDGIDTLRTLRFASAESPVVMAGGNVREENVAEIVRRSGVREVHTRATDPMIVRGVIRALDAETLQPS
jgi:copper homeostasis protein